MLQLEAKQTSSRDDFPYRLMRTVAEVRAAADGPGVLDLRLRADVAAVTCWLVPLSTAWIAVNGISVTMHWKPASAGRKSISAANMQQYEVQLTHLQSR